MYVTIIVNLKKIMPASIVIVTGKVFSLQLITNITPHSPAAGVLEEAVNFLAATEANPKGLEHT